MSQSTILRLTGIGVPPYSARGLTQTLQHIDAAVVQRRTINGVLRDLSDNAFRKYSSQISGTDVAPPAVDGVWPGMVLTVDCIPQLTQKVTSTTEPSTTELEAQLGRDFVPGSIVEADGFVSYRPRLTMMVIGFTMSTEEWTAGVPWSMNLEEV